MPENVKYNKLNIESKCLQNIIKMSCYRTETLFANLLSDYYHKSINEKRVLVKSIINSHADIIPDYNNNYLVVRIYLQTTSRMNGAIQKVCKLLNDKKMNIPAHSRQCPIKSRRRFL